jgi:hypothetical protein
MELVFIVSIVLIVLFMVNTINNTEVNTRLRCDEKGERHAWILRGSEDNTYLVCEKCKILLSGLKEEDDRGNYDF